MLLAFSLSLNNLGLERSSKICVDLDAVYTKVSVPFRPISDCLHDNFSSNFNGVHAESLSQTSFSKISGLIYEVRGKHQKLCVNLKNGQPLLIDEEKSLVEALEKFFYGRFEILARVIPVIVTTRMTAECPRVHGYLAS